MNVKKLICQLYETSIKELQAIDDLSVVYDMLNSQEYISWKDTLNDLSLDKEKPDR